MNHVPKLVHTIVSMTVIIVGCASERLNCGTHVTSNQDFVATKQLGSSLLQDGHPKSVIWADLSIDESRSPGSVFPERKIVIYRHRHWDSQHVKLHGVDAC